MASNGRDHGNQQRSNQRNKLKNTRDHSQHQRTRKSQQREAKRANHADKEAGGQLRANVSREGAVDVLKKLVTAPAPTSSRQHLQRRAAKSVGIFQQEETQNRNQNQPGNIDQPASHAGQHLADRQADLFDHAGNRAVDCVEQRSGHAMRAEVFDPVPAFFRRPTSSSRALVRQIPETGCPDCGAST